MARSTFAGLRRWAQQPAVYNTLVISIFIGGVLLMSLPAELLSYEAPEKATLNLATTFSDLSSQGWLSLVFIGLGFFLMVFDIVGGEFAGHEMWPLCPPFRTACTC